LSDLAHELENGTSITSLIKGAGQGSGAVAHTVADAHIVSPVMSEPAVIDVWHTLHLTIYWLNQSITINPIVT